MKNSKKLYKQDYKFSTCNLQMSYCVNRPKTMIYENGMDKADNSKIFYTTRGFPTIL